MTKDGTKSSQKSEMTPEEFAEKYKTESAPDPCYGLCDSNRQELLSDLRSVIRGKLVEFIQDHSDDDYYFRLEEAENIADEFLNNNQ